MPNHWQLTVKPHGEPLTSFAKEPLKTHRKKSTSQPSSSLERGKNNREWFIF
jgi:hypothetical protein